MILKRLLVVSTLLSGLVACSSTTDSNTKLTHKLATWMQGHFTSEQQAKQDKDFFNIHLNMTQIWPEQSDEIWLYVEQAAESYLEKPYRQRVYKLSQQDNGVFASEVFTLEEPLQYAGAYNTPAVFDKISPADLTLKEGCAVYLTWDENTETFKGSTKEDLCKSVLRGASYATSKVTVSKDGILSWDRGFNDEHKQVWGAVKAGYMFDRI